MTKSKVTTEQMTNLAIAADVTFDGGDDNPINVFANLMTSKEYNAMGKAINSYEIKGKGYTIGCWNDSSSYTYWKKQGESGDSNYIQITAYITDTSKVDPKVLKADMIKALNDMSDFDNSKDYHNS